MKNTLRVLGIALLVLALPAATQSQQSPKKQITQDVYDTWRSISGSALSPDGRWAVYNVSPGSGQGEMIVRSTSSATEYRFTRGSGAGASRFTADSRYLVFIAGPPSGGGGAAAAPPDTTAPAGPRQTRSRLGILDLNSAGQATYIPEVRAFTMSDENARFIVYSLFPPQAAAPAGRGGGGGGAAAAAAGGGRGRGQAAADSASQEPRRTYGSAIVLRDMRDGSETRIEDVASHEFDPKGERLAYIVSSRDSTRDGVYLRTLADGRVQPLMTGMGVYRQFSFDREGQQILFTSNRDSYSTSPPQFALYHATVRQPNAVALITPAMLPDSARLADGGAPSFTRSGTAIRLTLQWPRIEAVPASALQGRAVYDLWHYQDPRIQPQQVVSANSDRNRSEVAVFHLAERRLVQLTNDSLSNANLSDDARVGIQTNNRPYAIQAMWGDGRNDVYLLDPLNGTRKLIRKEAAGGTTLSPGAKYAIFFEDLNWHTYSIETGRVVNVTNAVAGVQFDREDEDRPSTPSGVGVLGWTAGDQSVLIYDKYDIWEFDPAGVRPPRSVTDSVGRKNKIIFRALSQDNEDRFLDPSKPLLLRATDEDTRATGFWTDRIGVSAPPQKIVMMDKNMGTPEKARGAEQYMLTIQTANEFPDLWTGTRLDQLQKISNANPQQSDYRWSTVEMVRWLNNDGIPVKGLLYKPEDFDPTRQYPMIVTFYEQSSGGLHNYTRPGGSSSINTAVYVSKGYLVFRPDIYYPLDGYPGRAAYNSIVPGVQALIARGYVDPKAIGIQGHSWGGYQTAYLITQTNMFAAAIAGAPVWNMTSAYGGIRWSSGLARAFQYERTQSRIGGSLWEFPERFIANSPIFHADRVTTPVFILHNDEDGAVPWYQGIEMYVSLRRIGSPVWMINYNGNGHSPSGRANTRDADMKYQQFMDTFVMKKPAPQWISEGIPYIHKGRDQIAPAITAPDPTASAGRGGPPPNFR